MKPDVKKYLQKIGQKGGMVKNDRKRAAVRLNLSKARKAQKTARNAKLVDLKVSESVVGKQTIRERNQGESI